MHSRCLCFLHSGDKGTVGTTLENLVLEYGPALEDFGDYKGGFLRRWEVLD